MRNPREELTLVKDVQAALEALRLRSERLPEGHTVRVMVETTMHLPEVEDGVRREVEDLRRSVEELENR